MMILALSPVITIAGYDRDSPGMRNTCGFKKYFLVPRLWFFMFVCWLIFEGVPLVFYFEEKTRVNYSFKGENQSSRTINIPKCDKEFLAKGQFDREDREILLESQHKHMDQVSRCYTKLVGHLCGCWVCFQLCERISGARQNRIDLVVFVVAMATLCFCVKIEFNHIFEEFQEQFLSGLKDSTSSTDNVF